jgi:NAD(P)-dependent dehydrogenase (short-subunit alcohol dehydrogenase family)
MVTNAGILRDTVLWKMTDEQFDAVIETHLRGTFTCARAAAIRLREQGEGGSLILVGSPTGQFGNFGQTNYAAAKAGIVGLTLNAAAELARYGVTVNAIAPAARTRMTEVAMPDMMRAPESGFDAMAPENVSPLVVWLGSAESKDVTGRVFEVEGGIVGVADGWQHGPRVDNGDRWSPADLGDVVRRLLDEAPAPTPVYGTS